MHPGQQEHHVVAACDDVYAMPLAATAASVASSSHDPGRLHFTVIDCGMSEKQRRRIRTTIEAFGAAVTLPRFASHIPSEALRGGVVPSVATYARLFAADYCSADRAVYLDSDTVVRTDLGAALEQLRPGDLVAGVVDTQGDGLTRNINRLAPYAPTDLGDSPYVNAGVLVLDVSAWRAEGISGRSTQMLARHAFTSGDQDVINLVCAGRIGVLPPELNVQTHLLRAQADGGRTALASADILHYTLRPKPWHGGGDVGNAAAWYDAVDRTAWKGWRPTPRRLIGPKLRRGWRLARMGPGRLVTAVGGRAR